MIKFNKIMLLLGRYKINFWNLRMLIKETQYRIREKKMKKLIINKIENILKDLYVF